ncbi:MAG: hypothetical protein HRU19_33080 [Pseudobacteriovorax sp.]|nr:hypothetical protein [Pseudobacteriovorax sp.]
MFTRMILLLSVFMSSFTSSASELEDQFEVMMGQESFYFTSLNDAQQVPSLWRKEFTELAYSIVDHLQIDRRAVALSTKYFDRYLSTLEKAPNYSECATISLSALHLSVSMFFEPKVHILHFNELLRHKGINSNIESMQRKLLNGLGYRLHPPIDCDYIRMLSQIFGFNRSFRGQQAAVFAEYLTVISKHDEWVSSQPQNIVAFAALNLSLEIFGSSSIRREMQAYEDKLIELNIEIDELKAMESMLSEIYRRSLNKAPDSHNTVSDYEN